MDNSKLKTAKALDKQLKKIMRELDHCRDQCEGLPENTGLEKSIIVGHIGMAMHNILPAIETLKSLIKRID